MNINRHRTYPAVLVFLDFAKRGVPVTHRCGGEVGLPVGLSNDTSAQIYPGLQVGTRQQNTSSTVICMMRKMTNEHS